MGQDVTLSDQAYTGDGLDRAERFRTDPAWLAAQRARADARLLCLWQGRWLVQAGPDRGQVIFEPQAVGAPIPSAVAQAFLGLDAQGAPHFALDLSDLTQTQVQQILPGTQAVGLRALFVEMPTQELARLAYAQGLLHWQAQQRYCGRCGHPTRIEQGGHLQRCTSADCAQEHYPRLNPAVIMLVEHRGPEGARRCLLARRSGMPEGRFSTLAGFVEVGESLEEAVAREVREEVALEVTDLSYRGSQPWPFPASLMLAFRARVQDPAHQVDGQELCEGRWFDAESLRRVGEWDDPQATLSISPKDSIARRLIDEWVAEVLGESSD